MSCGGNKTNLYTLVYCRQSYPLCKTGVKIPVLHMVQRIPILHTVQRILQTESVGSDKII